MRFTAVFIAAAVVAQFFDKIALFAKPFIALDVLTISIEYGYKGTENWRRSFLECLNDVFQFGTDNHDSRFAFGCSYAIMNDQNPNDIKLANRKPPNVDTTSCGCQSNRHENQIDPVLVAAWSVFHYTGFRDVSTVTIIFADETLNYSIKFNLAQSFIDWPNQLYLAIENSTADTSTLAKQGFDISHLLKFTVGECPQLVSQLQQLLCRGAPNLGPCEHITSDPGVCKAALEGYEPSRLENVDYICPDLLVATPAEKGQKLDCVCNTSVLATVTSDAHASDTTAKKSEADTGLSGGIIAIIVVGAIVLLVVVAGCIWCCVFRRSGGSVRTAGAKGGSQTARAGAGGSQWSPSQRVEGGASPKSAAKLQKSVSKSRKSVSKQPQKSVSKQPQKSVSKQSQKSVSKQPQKSVSKQPQKSVSKQPQKSVSKQSQKSVSKQPQKSVSKQPQKSVSKQSQKSVSKPPQKSMKSVVRGGQSKTGGSKIATSGMRKM